jgi:hypothetical protein
VLPGANPEKIIAIQKYPLPEMMKQIKGFIGLLSYYRKLNKDFAHITKPLIKCLKKDAKIDINDPQYIKCFNLCKNLLIDEPIIQYGNWSSALSNVKGGDLPISYARQTLNEAETYLPTIEKELFAIVWAVKYFRLYIYGRKFKILSNHNPLQWLFSLLEPNSKLFQCHIKLEEYDYEIVYKKGSSNNNADALSRVETNMNKKDYDQR